MIGLGRVGLATGVGLAVQGHEVVCYDVDAAKVGSTNSGKQPYHEPGLSKALKRVVKTGRIIATVNPRESLRRSAFYFICVGTPPLDDGSMDSSFLASASKSIGGAIGGRRDHPVIVVKSTVIPGTTEGVVAPAIKSESGLTQQAFGLCVNPEFLREGTAFEDTMKPDRIVIGSIDKKSGDGLERIYFGFDCVKWRCDLRTAEMVKYATNSFLATKATFANEIANMCNAFGLDSDKVLEGMALDSRINPRYLVPGAGFGGSCLPKDVRAVIAASRRSGYEPRLLEAVIDFNERQASRVVDILREELGSLDGKRVAVLGLAFKAGTDDSRESRAVPIIRELLKSGAHVVVHDPAAKASELGGNLDVEVGASAADALDGADGCIIQASWREYSALGKTDFSRMRKPIVVDGRRTFDLKHLPEGVIYRRIG